MIAAVDSPRGPPASRAGLVRPMARAVINVPALITRGMDDDKAARDQGDGLNLAWHWFLSSNQRS